MNEVYRNSSRIGCELQPIGLEYAKSCIRSDGPQSYRMDASEIFLTFLKLYFLVSKLIDISFYTFIIT